MAAPLAGRTILVMGVGNSLMQDDGAGIHIAERLRASGNQNENVAYMDGGTIGLSLLPAVEQADALIIVDAAELNAPAGTIRVFLNDEIDKQLSGRKKTVHEVTISDLLSAAALSGTRPSNCALVAIQPGSTELGLHMTDAVQAAVPAACAAVDELTTGFQYEA
jgi:hydrogenase maturation protease